MHIQAYMSKFQMSNGYIQPSPKMPNSVSEKATYYLSCTTSILYLVKATIRLPMYYCHLWVGALKTYLYLKDRVEKCVKILIG